MKRSPKRRPAVLLLLLTLLAALLAFPLPGLPAAAASEVAPAAALTTPWTDQVGQDNALPEYPRPAMTRPDWQNLNGTWQFEPGSAGQAPPIGRPLSGSVLVPYPIESALSGVQAHHDRMWYRRAFTVPAGWSGRQVQLNFGAVDWQAEVWVNGVKVGGHAGGYAKFSFDITAQLKPGDNELVVGVFDPTDAGGQPVGKQRLNSTDRIFYTPSSGIWQTVWLEPTAAAHVTRLDITPDLPAASVRVVPHAAAAAGLTARVTVRTGGTAVATGTGPAGAEIVVPVPNPRLWSPDDPFLYDLTVSLERDGTAVDTVGGYFGMRSIGKANVGGVLRPVLNGQYVFSMGTLDQGFWPDGLHTAPTDEALKFDLQAHKDLGFNTVRKHIKVEPERWYYWADRLGLMVWQDMPSMTPTRAPSPLAKARFETELHDMVDQLRSVTSIVQWVPFNEGWGEYDPARIADLVHGWDPSRLVNNNSGSNCCGFDGGNGDVIDDHVYVAPGSTQRPVPGRTPQPPSATRVAVLGEYGGLGLAIPGHEWQPGHGGGYENVSSPAALTSRYVSLLSVVQGLAKGNGLSGAIYTEITDVENETNGLYTYDRRVLKPDAARIAAANRAIIAGRPVAESVPLHVNARQSLRVTTPGLTDRYARHLDGQGVTSVVTGGSPALEKQDATWQLVPGLADPSCFSLRSVNYPGDYLRHRDSQLFKEPFADNAVYRADATWCARPGLNGTDVSFESYNFPGEFLRHYQSRLWLAGGAGVPGAHNSAAFFPEDVTWQVAVPWAP
ncbi:AbfB domain-containing protein [Amycolatopsis nigrescens]|uniref:AbfB domain-containing protein n=1 Tax=Amycolatopsis nigrescens TaxID=381445 RepID=UPI000378A106|nr:AbfB domain-containing protein [Amycolatopsis nigrescens]